MEDEWSLIPYPSENGNEIILSDGLSYGILHSDVIHDLAAWLFIRWMQKPENQSKLISITYSLPFTSNVRETMSKRVKQVVIWEEIQKYLPQVKSMPMIDSWLIAGKVLQDAAWQVVQSNMKPGDVKTILISADNLVKELVEK
jgi:ABC-type glycerol-3-phosphate transport system substrate-binding protein